MRVKVSDPRYLRDLVLFLRECGCVVEQAGVDEAEVHAPAAPSDGAARTEVGVYIAAWRVKSTPAHAELRE